ncbi:hypothetical protein NE237_026239 [Protea cynaroides]|uniref:Uncharacterized protein n=1 Tax=Protea cynaroides TaxID=273540 RepID=A0A9Q0H3V5_9MAGN|nr:hypothetical protein NE237_026239 [Protea cynaroides]
MVMTLTKRLLAPTPCNSLNPRPCPPLQLLTPLGSCITGGDTCQVYFPVLLRLNVPTVKDSKFNLFSTNATNLCDSRKLCHSGTLSRFALLTTLAMLKCLSLPGNP